MSYSVRNVDAELERLSRASQDEYRQRRGKTRKHPPVFLPLSSFGLGNHPYRIIHRAYTRLVWHRYSSRESRRLLVSDAYHWARDLRRRSRKLARRYGPRVLELTGKSLAQQRREMLYLGLRYTIPPYSYYLFRLFDSKRRKKAPEFIHRFETKAGLFAFLNANLGDASAGRLLGDKRQFAARCLERGLPTPPLYFELEAGEVVPRQWKSEGLPEVDLIVKRRIGKGGHVIMRWEYLGEGRYRSADAETLDAAALLDRLKKSAEEIPFLVMKRLRNHRDILDFAGVEGRILTTCRIVTAFNEKGEPEVVSSTYKIAVDQTVADNVHFGGLASPVDVETGELGPGISTSPLGEPVDVHPLSGRRIAGAKLPLWTETLELVERAHRQFPEAIFIGWDVGITDDGPVLIEGNVATCVHLQQTPHGEPIGSQRFGQIMAYQLGRIDHDTADYHFKLWESGTTDAV